jgi:hypothetical protein
MIGFPPLAKAQNPGQALNEHSGTPRRGNSTLLQEQLIAMGESSPPGQPAATRVPPGAEACPGSLLNFAGGIGFGYGLWRMPLATRQNGNRRINRRLVVWKVGGGRGIRTPGTLSSTTVFKTAGFNHSPIPPRWAKPASFFSLSQLLSRHDLPSLPRALNANYFLDAQFARGYPPGRSPRRATQPWWLERLRTCPEPA